MLAAVLAALSARFRRGGLSGGGAGAGIRSIAVLPLENLSHDPEQEYFADGMTEELIHRAREDSRPPRDLEDLGDAV